jgi:hypothetical protein
MNDDALTADVAVDLAVWERALNPAVRRWEHFVAELEDGVPPANETVAGWSEEVAVAVSRLTTAQADLVRAWAGWPFFAADPAAYRQAVEAWGETWNAGVALATAWWGLGKGTA